MEGHTDKNIWGNIVCIDGEENVTKLDDYDQNTNEILKKMNESIFNERE